VLRLPVEFHAATFDSSIGHDEICHFVDVFQILDLNTEMRFRKENFNFGAALELKQGEVFFDRVAFPAATHLDVPKLGPVFDADGDDVILGLVQSVVWLAAFVSLHATVEALPFKDRRLLSKRLDEVDQFHQCHSCGS